jgi:endoglucanase Acf2
MATVSTMTTVSRRFYPNNLSDFHYGYYIYAGAVVLKYNPMWEYRDHILDLARDIANPSARDPYFPITRYASDGAPVYTQA